MGRPDWQCPDYVGIPQDLIPTTAQLNDLNGRMKFTMVGYPNGLWDTKNDLPIIRRGITATPAFRDYCGRDEFLIDAACFPGSSGSPVFILNQGLHTTSGAILISAYHPG